jgi:hypothetical protein
MTRILEALRKHRRPWLASLQCGFLQAFTVRLDRLG